MSNIFITSDLHLNHGNIIKYCNRPFNNIEEMNITLINNWNSIVSNNDTIIFLGDFALGTKETIIRFGNMLNGHKILVRGNHDYNSETTFYEAGFERIYKKPIELQLGKYSYICSHAPVECDKYTFNLFGHTHDKRLHDRNHYCCCVEMNDYKPVNIKIIEEYFKSFGIDNSIKM